MKWDPTWEAIFASQAWGKYPAEPLIRFVARNYYQTERRHVRFLELGCGPGANIWFLAREGFGFVGVDGSPTAIRQATERLDAECPDWRERGQLYVADVTELDLPQAAFDAVIDNECVSCMPYRVAVDVYRASAAWLKPGGRLFVRTFSDETWGRSSGKCIEADYYACSEGPLANKGATRFTQRAQIDELLGAFTRLQVEKTTVSYGGGEQVVAEWLIEGVKA